MTVKTRCPNCGRLFKCVEAHQIAKPCRAPTPPSANDDPAVLRARIASLEAIVELDADANATAMKALEEIDDLEAGSRGAYSKFSQAQRIARDAINAIRRGKPATSHDESFADRAVQAEIDRACGIPSDDDWLLP